jgi:pectate lyase
MKTRLSIWSLALCVLPALGFAAEEKAVHFLKKPDSWFASDAGRFTAEVILSYQAKEGGWPKNTNTVSRKFEGDPGTLKGTFDNSATTDELRFLARSYHATKEDAYKAAFLRGLKHILEAQYANGGWPQYFPLPPTYNRRITFNDGCMVRLMLFLKEVYILAECLPSRIREGCALHSQLSDCRQRRADCVVPATP